MPVGWSLWVDPATKEQERRRLAYAAGLQEKAQAKEAKAQVKRDRFAAKAQDREDRRVAQAAAEAEDLENFGELLISERFAGRQICIYANGYVRIALLKVTTSSLYHQLVSLTADVNAIRKNGVGRAVGAVITQGWSLDTSDLRGDIYVTIVTGDEVFSLHTDSPTADNIAAVRRLEAVTATL